MVVSLKEFIEESKVLEEVEDELAGIRGMTWHMTNYSENLETIKNITKTFYVHISELLDRINEIKYEQEKIKNELDKQGIDYSGDPWYVIYKSQETVDDLRLRIIGYLSLMLDTLNTVVNNLKMLLNEARSYGIMKQKVETELEVIKELKNNFIETLAKMREHTFENDKRIAEILNKLILRQETYSSTFTEKIEKLGEKLEVLESELENLKSEKKKKLKAEELEIKEQEKEQETDEEKIKEIIEEFEEDEQ
jgi:chromosome segregation ATPase